MARNKGRKGGKGSGDRHLHAVEPTPRMISHIGSDGLRVDEPEKVADPASPPAAPATLAAVGLPVVAVRTSATTAVVRSDQTPAKAEPFKLLVEAMGTDSPSVRVGWCLSPATVAELRDKHKVPVANIRMLLLVTREMKTMLVEVERRLVKLDSPVEYFRFEQPGSHRIHGFIVWSNLGDEDKAHAELFNSFVDKKTDKYISCLTDGMTARIAANVPKLEHVAEHRVEVPSAFFAKKPTFKRFQWLADFWWWFTNLWFAREPVDQCVFRERWLFWTLPKLVMVPLYCILTVLWRGACALFLLLLGRRPSHMKFRAIWRPFDYNFGHLIDAPNHHFLEARAYVWLTNSRGRQFDATMWPIRIPLVWIGAAIGSYYIHQHFEFGGGVSNIALTPMLVVSTIVAWALICLVIVIVARMQDRAIRNEPARQEEARRRADAKARAEAEALEAKSARQEAKRLANYTRLIESGPVCDSDSAPASPPTVWDLPWTRWSPRLVYQHAKAKVCKPYAK